MISIILFVMFNDKRGGDKCLIEKDKTFVFTTGKKGSVCNKPIVLVLRKQIVPVIIVGMSGWD